MFGMVGRKRHHRNQDPEEEPDLKRQCVNSRAPDQGTVPRAVADQGTVPCAVAGIKDIIFLIFCYFLMNNKTFPSNNAVHIFIK